MPRWTDEPPPGGEIHAFRIIRTPATRPIVAVVTCLELNGCPTHFVKNRTIPCERPNPCPAHDQGYSWRWHGYVSCVLSGSYEHVIFEMTAQASDTFKNYQLNAGTLRGCWFRSRRPTGRSNGRVVIECKPTDPVTTRLPEPPNVRRILCHIWNVPYHEVQLLGTGRPPFRDIRIPATDEDGRYTAKPARAR